MNDVEVVVVSRQTDYMAYFAKDQDKHECGHTVEEAVGKLLINHVAKVSSTKVRKHFFFPITTGERRASRKKNDRPGA